MSSHKTQDEYLPSDDNKSRRGSNTDLPSTGTKRVRLGGGMGHGSTSRLQRPVDPFEDESSSQFPQVDGEVQRSTTSRIRAKLADYSHICQPCRHVFAARSKPVKGLVLCALGVLLLIGYYLNPQIFKSNFWMFLIYSASLVFVGIGLLQFRKFTDCPNCGSERTSSLDSAHGRQIQTETIVKSGTSYIRKRL